MSSSFTETAPGGSLGPPLIGALLRVPWESVRRRMLGRLHELGFDDLDAAHLNVFQFPGPQGARPSELATRLRMSRQALNYLLGELERRGYLERRADAEDQRSKRIALTGRGEAVLATMRETVEQVERDWTRELGANDFRRLRELLEKLNELVDGAERRAR
jgi:DNA-binding MarR family transcriptional regulator